MLSPKVLQDAPRLKWVQALGTGVDNLIDQEALRKDVIVTNVDKVVFTRDKWNGKLYRNHTGYVGGLKTRTAKEMLARDPEEILRLAVYGMTNKSSLARHQMKKLKLYTTAEHPHKAQNPKPLKP